MLPQAQETDGVPRPHPVLDNISRILGRPVFGYVCQGNEISVVPVLSTLPPSVHAPVDVDEVYRKFPTLNIFVK